MPKRNKRSEGVSVVAMTAGVMIFIAWFFWGVAASACFGAVIDPALTEGAGGESLWFGVSGLITFFGNSVRFHRLPEVVTYVFTKRPGILWTFLIVELLALGFGLWVRRLETQFATASARKHKKVRYRPPSDEDDDG